MAVRLATQDGVPYPDGAEDLREHFLAPAGESKKDRERRQARDRQRKKRLLAAQAALRAEAITVNLELYSGSIAALDKIKAVGEFDGPDANEDIITRALHGLAGLAERDRHEFMRLMGLLSRKGLPDAGV